MAEGCIKESPYFQYCLNSRIISGRTRALADIFYCVWKHKTNSDELVPTKKDWLVLAEMFPSIIDNAVALIDEGKIRCVCDSEHADARIYRVYSGSQNFNVFPKYNSCSCAEFRLIANDEQEVTCQHVLACALVDVYKMVQLPPENHANFDLKNLTAEES